MTFAQARWRVDRIRRDHPDLKVDFGYGRQSDNWYVTIQETGAADWIRLPDALSVQSYLDARRGYRAEAGAPDFGPGGV